MYDGLDRAICSHQSAPRLPDGMKGQGEREIGHLWSFMIIPKSLVLVGKW